MESDPRRDLQQNVKWIYDQLTHQPGCILAHTSPVSPTVAICQAINQYVEAVGVSRRPDQQPRVLVLADQLVVSDWVQVLETTTSSAVVALDHATFLSGPEPFVVMSTQLLPSAYRSYLDNRNEVLSQGQEWAEPRSDSPLSVAIRSRPYHGPDWVENERDEEETQPLAEKPADDEWFRLSQETQTPHPENSVFGHTWEVVVVDDAHLHVARGMERWSTADERDQHLVAYPFRPLVFPFLALARHKSILVTRSPQSSQWLGMDSMLAYARLDPVARFVEKGLGTLRTHVRYVAHSSANDRAHTDVVSVPLTRLQTMVLYTFVRLRPRKNVDRTLRHLVLAPSLALVQSKPLRDAFGQLQPSAFVVRHRDDVDVSHELVWRISTALATRARVMVSLPTRIEVAFQSAECKNRLPKVGCVTLGPCTPLDVVTQRLASFWKGATPVCLVPHRLLETSVDLFRTGIGSTQRLLVLLVDVPSWYREQQVARFRGDALASVEVQVAELVSGPDPVGYRALNEGLFRRKAKSAEVLRLLSGSIDTCSISFASKPGNLRSRAYTRAVIHAIHEEAKHLESCEFPSVSTEARVDTFLACIAGRPAAVPREEEKQTSMVPVVEPVLVVEEEAPAMVEEPMPVIAPEPTANPATIPLEKVPTTIEIEVDVRPNRYPIVIDQEEKDKEKEKEKDEKDKQAGDKTPILSDTRLGRNVSFLSPSSSSLLDTSPERRPRARLLPRRLVTTLHTPASGLVLPTMVSRPIHSTPTPVFSRPMFAPAAAPAAASVAEAWPVSVLTLPVQVTTLGDSDVEVYSIPSSTVSQRILAEPVPVSVESKANDQPLSPLMIPLPVESPPQNPIVSAAASQVPDLDLELSPPDTIQDEELDLQLSPPDDSWDLVDRREAMNLADN